MMDIYQLIILQGEWDCSGKSQTYILPGKNLMVAYKLSICQGEKEHKVCSRKCVVMST